MLFKKHSNTFEKNNLSQTYNELMLLFQKKTFQSEIKCNLGSVYKKVFLAAKGKLFVSFSVCETSELESQEVSHLSKL